MVEAFSEARLGRFSLGAGNNLIRQPSLAGCGGFKGSTIPPTPLFHRFSFSFRFSQFFLIFSSNFKFQLARAGAGTAWRTGRLGGPQPWPIEI